MPDSSQVKRTPDGRRRAPAVIKFIERLTVPSGHGMGKPFELEPFQKLFIRAIYEPHLGLRRAVRRAILSMARKNGKTALIAAIVLAHLVGPEAVVHGEIYSAANDRDQAAIVYKFARQMVELEPELAAEIDLVPSTKTMIARRTGSVYRAISAEAGTKHGYLPSVVIYDELAQAKNRDLYDVLDTSFGARDEPLFIVISTQSNDPEHIMSKLIDDGISGIDPAICCHHMPPMRIASWRMRSNGARRIPRSENSAIMRTSRPRSARRSGCPPRSRKSAICSSISASRRSLADQPRRVDGLRWRCAAAGRRGSLSGA